MVKKTVTYTDFDGKEVTEDLYFHLTEGDLMDWLAKEEDDIITTLVKIMKTSEPKDILPMVKDLLKKSYGVKSPDGRAFIKNEETSKFFEYTQAFSDIYVDLITNSDNLLDFINGIVPEKFRSTGNVENTVSMLEALPSNIINDEDKRVIADRLNTATE